jgi:hypothetical protein
MKYTSHLVGILGANNYTFAVYRCSALYDIAVSATDNSQPFGFEEFSAMYSQYRVDTSYVDVTFVNREDFACNVIISFVNTDPTTALTSAIEMLDLGERPWAKRGIISAKGGMDRIRLRSVVNVAKFFGTRALQQGELGFYGGPVTNPLYVVYLVVGVASLAGDLLTNGVGLNVALSMKTEWSNRIVNSQLASTGSTNKTIFQYRNTSTSSNKGTAPEQCVHETSEDDFTLLSSHMASNT